MNWATARFRFVMIVHEMSVTYGKLDIYTFLKAINATHIYSKGHVCWMEPRQP